jgi:hypothetical protein
MNKFMQSMRRRIVANALIFPGTTYTVRSCALGGSTNQGPWSDPVTRMATKPAAII